MSSVPVNYPRNTDKIRGAKLSALLEAHESLPGCLSSTNSSRHMRRVHAEQHSSFMTSTLRTTFSLDIPPDGSPAFQVDVVGQGQSSTRIPSGSGGLEWKVRLCLLVAVGSVSAVADSNGVRLKNLIRDGPRGDWGSSWKAAPTIAPKERPEIRAQSSADQGTSATSPISWVSYFANAILGASETGYHDGDEDIEDEDGSQSGEVWGNEEDWRDVKVEMVECEVPIKVWPGNTAFKASEITFDV